VIAVLAGLGAAGAWALTTICYSRATQTVGSLSVISVAMAVGLALVAPAIAIAGIPEGLDAETVALLVVAGSANLIGLFLVVNALRIGKVGIVAPIVSTEGAVAAVIAVIAGETIARGAGAMLAVIVVGIAVASVSRDRPEVDGPPRRPYRAASLAVGAALVFGVSLYATGRVSEDLPVVWALLPARAIGVLALTMPLLLAGRLHVERRTFPLVALAGVGEVVGFALFALGARDSIAVSAVLASQFGVLAGIGAFLLFGERLTRPQKAGIGAIAAGVAVLTWIQA
jgi:drug/metabolite transporter (DMT)-like permease